jgi:hypothetical protein
MEGGRLDNAGVIGTPTELPCEDVWPRARAHLLDTACYVHEQVAAMIKGQMCISEALLHFHYPTLFNDPMVLFCDTGDHIVIYIARPVDKE